MISIVAFRTKNQITLISPVKQNNFWQKIKIYLFLLLSGIAFWKKKFLISIVVFRTKNQITLISPVKQNNFWQKIKIYLFLPLSGIAFWKKKIKNFDFTL